jgi:hypothetical protein
MIPWNRHGRGPTYDLILEVLGICSKETILFIPLFFCFVILFILAFHLRKKPVDLGPSLLAYNPSLLESLLISFLYLVSFPV